MKIGLKMKKVTDINNVYVINDPNKAIDDEDLECIANSIKSRYKDNNEESYGKSEDNKLDYFTISSLMLKHAVLVKMMLDKNFTTKVYSKLTSDEIKRVEKEILNFKTFIEGACESFIKLSMFSEILMDLIGSVEVKHVDEDESK